MEKLGKVLEKTLSALTAIALIAMMLHSVSHALSRFFFNAPLYGTNELVTFWYLPIITLIGFVAAQWRKQHIAVSLLFDRLRNQNQIEYTVFSRSLGILLCLGFAWFGFAEALDNMSIGRTAGVTAISIWPVTFLVPIVFTLLWVLYVTDIVNAVKGAVEALEQDDELSRKPTPNLSGASSDVEQHRLSS